jgi:hypothetical protein
VFKDPHILLGLETIDKFILKLEQKFFPRVTTEVFAPVRGNEPV